MYDESAAKQRSAVRRYGRNARSGMGTGTVSLLMIFTVLCFATIALLSVSTAASDRRIQQRSFERTVALSSAEGRSAERLAALDQMIFEYRATKAGTGDEARAAMQELAYEQGWTPGDETYTILWAEPIDRENNLVTVVTLLSPEDADRYELVSQTAEYVGTWEPEQGGSVWSGGLTVGG